ncbi:MAG: pantoate--beta-alanine ligase [Candidatus Abyssobacteria bacterium SURF_5]|uniref:Pantothenate synthetase n=1 Tax=Abyssobacteria bacterium (strain SURF_5) TaxID=2093360 RepID=A0A3A4PDG8_ABYX5|nr:MAG: pantoate--beta-alanine ligase [Candidatus Abyssubacteria bacterium SURF_5]
MRTSAKRIGKRRPDKRQLLIIRDPAEMQALANQLRRAGKTIGFVPTMGYLHEGHASLLRGARRDNDAVVLSIFVNPTQFGPNEDLDKYPRDMIRDENIARQEGTDYIFYPEPRDVYPSGYQTHVSVEKLTKSHCGISRPTHFGGVATVCTKLFNLVLPHRAYFGQKDYQQCAVIKRMVKDLNMNLEIVVLPTAREADGLAMSSRNAYLKPDERVQAVCLYEALQLAKSMATDGERKAANLISAMREHIQERPSARIDYLSVADVDTLEELETLQEKAVVLLAVFMGKKTRLIDNEVITVH